MSIAANSRWNLLGFSCTLAAHIITVPVAIKSAGLAEFGRAGLVLAVWAPLFIGTVLGNSVVHLVSSSEPTSHRQTLLSALNNALLLCSGLGIALIALVVGLVPWLFTVIVPGPVSLDTWRTNFLIVAVSWLAQQYSLVVQGAFAGERQFRTIALINLVGASVTVAAVIVCLQMWPTGSGYLAGLACGFLATATSWLAAARLRHGPLALRHSRQRDTFGRLVNFGKWQAVTFLSGNFANQIDRYALGVIAPARVIGQFNAANRLQEAVYSLVSKATEVLFPHFGANSTLSRENQLGFFLRATWATITFAAVALVPGMALAHPLLELWAGREVADGGGLMLKTLLLGGLIGCASNVATYYFMGVGQAMRVATLSLWYSGITVAGSLLLLYTVGPLAAGGGIVIASTVRVCMSVVHARRDFGAALSAPRVWWSNVTPLLIGCLIALALELTPLDSLGTWFGVIAAYAIIGILVAVACGMSLAIYPEGRGWIRDLLAALRTSPASSTRIE